MAFNSNLGKKETKHSVLSIRNKKTITQNRRKCNEFGDTKCNDLEKYRCNEF